MARLDRIVARKKRLTDRKRILDLAWFEARDAGDIPLHRKRPRRAWITLQLHRCDVLLDRRGALPGVPV